MAFKNNNVRTIVLQYHDRHCLETKNRGLKIEDAILNDFFKEG